MELENNITYAIWEKYYEENVDIIILVTRVILWYYLYKVVNCLEINDHRLIPSLDLKYLILVVLNWARFNAGFFFQKCN